MLILSSLDLDESFWGLCLGSMAQTAYLSSRYYSHYLDHIMPAAKFLSRSVVCSRRQDPAVPVPLSIEGITLEIAEHLELSAIQDQ